MKNIFLMSWVLTSSILNAQPTCKSKHTPIVFVHGFMGSGDNWATQIQRFVQNGYCDERLFVFDWNSVSGGTTTIPSLKLFIDEVLTTTKAEKINLVAHSAGGGICYSLLKDSLYSSKVERYVHIGSSKMKNIAGAKNEIPTLNIYSTADLVARNGGDIPNATNIKQSSTDHMQVATSEESFVAMYQFFNNNQNPAKVKVAPSKEKYKLIQGRGVFMAENTPLSNDSFRVNIFNASTGQIRYVKNNKGTLASYVNWTKFDSAGRFKLRATDKDYLEFEVKPKNGRTVYYYFEPAIANNKNYYLRAIPQSGMAAAMLKDIPNNNEQTALVVFSANSAMIAGRDSLAIDTVPLSIPTLMPASKTAIACFVFDDGDGKTSLQPLKSFAAAPFLVGADVMIPANNKGTMKLYYNGRTMVLPKRKSSDGIMVVVFQ